MAKPRTKEEQARINHAMALVQRGLQLIQEGHNQLRSRRVTVTNPLHGLETLGRTNMPEDFRFEESKEVKQHNARSGTRNSVAPEKKADRARAPRIARQR